MPEPEFDIVPLIMVSNEEFFLPYVLSSIAKRFNRYVAYSIGSEDRTVEILNWFRETEGADKVDVRVFPMLSREVQLELRNSMIAAACSKYYLLVDGDEIFSEESVNALLGYRQRVGRLALLKENVVTTMQKNDSLYGVCRRKELNYELTHRYTDIRTHHRIYDRTAYWVGRHPGEVPAIPQNRNTETDFPHILIHHFHNTLRSSTEGVALKRMERKSQKTYHPGELQPFNLLDELPILRTKIEDFPVSPVLEKLWESR